LNAGKKKRKKAGREAKASGLIPIPDFAPKKREKKPFLAGETGFLRKSRRGPPNHTEKTGGGRGRAEKLKC
jgi:hypothetical protein